MITIRGDIEIVIFGWEVGKGMVVLMYGERRRDLLHGKLGMDGAAGMIVCTCRQHMRLAYCRFVDQFCGQGIELRVGVSLWSLVWIQGGVDCACLVFVS